MREKTIKSILSRKFNEWVDSISDIKLRDKIKQNTVITGGCITSLLQNEKPNDYDVYFKNKETAKAVAQYYVRQWNIAHEKSVNKLNMVKKPYVLDGADVQQWKRGEKRLSEFALDYEDIPYATNSEELGNRMSVSHMITNTPEDRIKVIFPSDGILEEKEKVPGIDETIEAYDDLSEMDADLLEKGHENKEGEKYRPVFMTTNAITLSDGIQLVIRFYGEPKEIHETYDFIHCTCYWESSTKRLEIPQEALMSIINKELVYKGSKYPICSVIRTRKFLKRGWHINAGQYLKMAFQISELDLQNINVLEDQLVGVDSSYFTSVVNSLRKMQEKNDVKAFDSTYLASIIDKIF